jgi:hypothetical protein
VFSKEQPQVIAGGFNLGVATLRAVPLEGMRVQIALRHSWREAAAPQGKPLAVSNQHLI